MRPTFVILSLCLTLLLGDLSFAQVYKWVDEKGVVHFTDDIIQIPEKYRPTVERIGVTEETADTKSEGELSPKKKEDSYRDRLGRGEEYWKARVEEWEKKLRILQEKIENLRIKYNELTEKFNGSKSSVERISIRKERDQIKNEMDQYKVQIEEVKNMLEKRIPEEAELYKAKPEWVKQ
jgi:predicted  nucleic acid-binding Zn-ribbon protein